MSELLPLNTLIEGDCIEVLHRLPEQSVDLVFADPPYNLQLRQDLWRPNLTLVDAVKDEWDQFKDYQSYDQFTRHWLTACRRVLKDNGTLWVIGTYHNIYRVGSILQDLGYWILNDFTWIKCLAGDTELLALINGIPVVTTIKDLIRLNLSANVIQLPSYDESGCFCWVDVQGWQKNPKSNGLRIQLEDGQWVECTPEHRFPVFENGHIENIPAKDLKPGDFLLELTSFKLPRVIKSQGINEAVGEFVGWFLAEGSFRSEEKGITLSMSSEEKPDADKLIETIESCFGVMGRTHIYKKALHLVFPGHFMIELVRRFVRGEGAKNKRLAREAFLHGEDFLHGVLKGYLKGDGHWDIKNQRWRLGLARNKGLVADLSVICTMLGYRIRFHEGFVPYKDSKAEVIRGEIRENKDRRWDFIGIKELGLPSRRFFDEKQQNSVLRFREQYQIITRKNRDGQMTEAGKKMMTGDMRTIRIQSIETGTRRTFYDLSVGGNHIFALANGILTHNSNPMPNFRGVRFTNAHETLLWAQKKAGRPYTFNHHAMKALNDDLQMRSDWYLPICSGKERLRVNGSKVHTTQKPEALLYRILMSSTNPDDVVLDPFFGTGTTGVVAKKLNRRWIGIEKDPHYIDIARQRIERAPSGSQDMEVFRNHNPRREPRLPFGTLLENGLIQPGEQLQYGVEGGVTARVLADGSLEYDGRRGSIHQMARLIQAGPCNGWLEWYYFDTPTQKWQPIDQLRKHLRAQIENSKEGEQ